MASATIRSKGVDLLVAPLDFVVVMVGPCLVMQYFVCFLVFEIISLRKRELTALLLIAFLMACGC